MARAIDADALQELCDRRIQDTWNSRTAPVSLEYAYADFKDDIDSMPTLTPPNEPLCQENKIIIVKCKGCKYHKPIDYCEKHNDSGWYDDDFCSFGKKKE